MTAVVTDSAANVPPDLVRSLKVGVVPLVLRFGEEELRDGADVGGAAFYDRLAASTDPVTTAAPSPGDYLAAFEATGSEEVVCVTLASGLSAAHQQARLAADLFEGRVEVVDSGSATMGEGFVALAGARAAAEGASLQEAAEAARAAAGAVRVIGAIETFEYLRRSGRVGKVQAYAATALSIRPVFRLEGGEIRPVARPRTRTRALEMIASEVIRSAEGRPVRVGAFHAAAREDAEKLVRRIREEARVIEAHVVDSTPAIGAHTGPGLVGVALHVA